MKNDKKKLPKIADFLNNYFWFFSATLLSSRTMCSPGFPTFPLVLPADPARGSCSHQQPRPPPDICKANVHPTDINCRRILNRFGFFGVGRGGQSEYRLPRSHQGRWVHQINPRQKSAGFLRSDIFQMPTGV